MQGTEGMDRRFSSMKRFFFDLVGEYPARDMVGHQCVSQKEATEHAKFIAQRIGTEKPYFAKSGNFIQVRDEKGVEICEAPIQSTYVSDLPLSRRA
jgi:hypothetical protein